MTATGVHLRLWQGTALTLVRPSHPVCFNFNSLLVSSGQDPYAHPERMLLRFHLPGQSSTSVTLESHPHLHEQIYS
ncbi:hypothetical protein AGIG_G9550 [Arapaima gigas]